MNSSDMGSEPTGGLSEERSGCMGDVHPSIVPMEKAEMLAETDTVRSQGLSKSGRRSIDTTERLEEDHHARASCNY